MSDDSSRINDEIAQAYACGGGRIDLGRGVLQCDDPIRGASKVTLRGEGLGTVLQFTDPTRPAVCLGGVVDGPADALNNRTAIWPGLEHLTIDGGSYGLDLNNCLSGRFIRLVIKNNIQNVRGRGQLEGNRFEGVDCLDAQSNSVDMCRANGGQAGPLYNFSDCQKNTWDQCSFQRCRDLDEHGEPLSGLTPDNTEKPFGGAVHIWSEGGFVSGYNEFRRPVFIFNQGHSLHLENADATSIYDMCTEENPHDPRPRGYYGVWIQGPSSSVSIYGGKIIGAGGRPFSYGIQHDTGTLNLFGVQIGNYEGAGVFSGGQMNVFGGSISGPKPIWLTSAASALFTKTGVVDGSGIALGAPHVG